MNISLSEHVLVHSFFSHQWNRNSVKAMMSSFLCILYLPFLALCLLSKYLLTKTMNELMNFPAEGIGITNSLLPIL